MSTQVAPIKKPSALMSTMAARFGVPEKEMLDTLKATAFKGQVSDAQMTALLIVANQYGLNPWTKEIYAFPDKNNGIVPVVGVDGWSRIINEHAQFDGLDFEQDDEKCTCIVYRKDRSHPIKVTEYMSECRRSNAGPWQSHPKRMLRHKSLIQCARLAFGYVGIFDEDEAERIIEKDITPRAAAPEQPKEPVMYLDAQYEVNLPKWIKAIEDGKKTPDDIIAMVESKFKLTDAQKAGIRRDNKQPEVIDGEAVEVQ
jgi:phage recombination protein Bet